MALLEKCILSDNIMDYYVVSQGKTSIPGVNDGEEFVDTDVSKFCICQNISINWQKNIKEINCVVYNFWF